MGTHNNCPIDNKFHNKPIWVSGSLKVHGDITAETYITKTNLTEFTQSFSSGSTVFGDSIDDTHEFTGSLKITGSVTALNLTADSSSVSTRLTTEEGNVDALQYQHRLLFQNLPQN